MTGEERGNRSLCSETNLDQTCQPVSEDSRVEAEILQVMELADLEEVGQVVVVGLS